MKEERKDNPRSHMRTISRKEEGRGTRRAFLGAAVVALAAGAGLLAWFFVPSFSRTDRPQNAGILTDQTVGVSVQSQRTEPLPVTGSNSTGPYSVERNEQLSGTEVPNLKPLAPAQIEAIQRFASAHPELALPRVNFSIAVGAAVPSRVKLLPVPLELARVLPHYSTDLYIMVDNQFIVVERQTRRIVAIVPSPAVRESTQ